MGHKVIIGFKPFSMPIDCFVDSQLRKLFFLKPYGRQTVVAMTRPRSGERSYDLRDATEFMIASSTS